MITFRIEPHTVVAGRQVVVIAIDGADVATISDSGDSLRLISAHIVTVEHDTGEGRWPAIPSVRIALDPRPWHVGEDGKIVREL